MRFSVFFLDSVTVEVYLQWKLQTSPFFVSGEKWKNRQCIKYLFAPLYMCVKFKLYLIDKYILSMYIPKLLIITDTQANKQKDIYKYKP